MEDTVRITNDENWSKKATVLQEVALRSHTVKTDDGQILRHNRRNLLKTEKEVEDLDQSNAVSDSTVSSKTTDRITDSHTDTQTSDSRT